VVKAIIRNHGVIGRCCWEQAYQWIEFAEAPKFTG